MFRSLVTDVGELDAAVRGMKITLQELRGLVQRHGAALGTAPTADAISAVDKCAIAGLGGLAVTPSQMQAKTGSTSTFALDVRGGKVPYFADFSGRVPGGVTLVQAESSGSRLTLVVSDKAEVGSYQIRISDANGMLVNVPLELTK
jgi:hypothetical protein